MTQMLEKSTGTDIKLTGTEIKEAKKRYSAGVLKYKQMGWPANRPPPPGPWCGPTA